MLPLFSARTRRISKISSCLRMPVAPAISRSLAILVSAEMLISFIADSEIDCAPCCPLSWGGGPLFSWVLSGGGAVAAATPPFGLGALRSSSTVRPVLRPSPLRPAARGVQTPIRVHEHGASARRASVYPPWYQ